MKDFHIMIIIIAIIMFCIGIYSLIVGDLLYGLGFTLLTPPIIVGQIESLSTIDEKEKANEN